MIRTAFLFALVAVLADACASVRVIPSPALGSIDHPVCSDGPAAQRLYLRRLRTRDGHRVEFTREEPVFGPDGHLYDPYILRREGTPSWSIGFSAPRAGELPPRETDADRPVRIFMDMNRPGCVEGAAPQGFNLGRPD